LSTHLLSTSYGLNSDRFAANRSARATASIETRALSAGADDYIPDPREHRLLAARVKVLPVLEEKATRGREMSTA
jgi:DNA-binding response OmpR family regulator